MSKLNLQFSEVLYTNLETRVTVYRALVLPQGSPVTVKECVFTDLREANAALREALNMALVSHPGILPVYDCYFSINQEKEITVSIVSEYMESDLNKEIRAREHEKRNWSELELWNIFVCLISALSHAEERGISHRDIKPDNIFKTGDVIKIGDFGSSSKSLGTQMRETLVGSPLFLSPELKQGFICQLRTGAAEIIYDPVKSDVYSLGVTIVYMALLSPPTNLASIDHLDEATEQTLAMLANYPFLVPWIRLMLSPQAEYRPTFSQIKAALPVNNPEVPNGPEIETRVCINCTEAIKSVDWVSTVPNYLKPFRGFFEFVCSEACLEAKANTYPRSLCTVCGDCIGCGDDECPMLCGHKYHARCRRRFPTEEETSDRDCPQCYPKSNMEGVSLEELACIMVEDSLKNGKQKACR